METRLVALGMALLLVGCSTLEVSKVNGVQPPPPTSQGSAAEGVRFFLAKPVWMVTEKGAKDDRATTVGANKCPVIPVLEVGLEPTYVPDFDHFYAVRLDPGLFSSDTFTIDLKEHGALTKVLTKSEPQLVESLKAVASIVGPLLAMQLPPVKPCIPEDDDYVQARRKEVQRLETLRETYRSIVQKYTSKKLPNKQDLEAIELIRAQIAATQGEISVNKRAITEHLSLEGTKITKVSYSEPHYTFFDEWPPLGELKQQISDIRKKDPTKRVFIYLKPVPQFRDSKPAP